jgi:hypothetical protein
MSAGFMFLAFKKRITDRISHAAGFLISLGLKQLTYEDGYLPPSNAPINLRGVVFD